MRWNELYVAGTGAYLPEPVAVDAAVVQGRYAPDDRDDDDLESVAVSPTAAAPEMAVEAAAAALAGGTDPADVALLVYSGAYYQGQDLWTPASYVQAHTVGGSAPAWFLDNASNGGLAALDAGAAHLSVSPERRAALLVCADRYAEPGFDRFGSDSGVVFADGASALVLARDTGWARLVATTMTSDAGLEAMCREQDGFAAAAFEHGRPLSLRRRKAAFLAEHGLEEVLARISAAVAANAEATLADAKVDIGDVARVVLPNFGRSTLEWEFLDPLGIGLERTTWDWGRRVGHVGPADQFAALHHLASTGALTPGDRVLLVGLGIGFCWGSALLEIVEDPR